ncbi:thiazole tautomerase (transcriptional regulator TenI) [Anoxybacillus vitaminiphilus]|uniref:Thiazole tautomerase (Transcriptional regulator TenI) n=1 Tax=Paranoxybacillus vitaminiphilus TaxID=581036 RepID=A0A327YF11_9BACL|nr:thiazole tautomerase TenI [Anoxybacillus vitaminiphilus]RAK19444.1 thiazole tautomerase (transcriptional regulator TenI) [Anoxybacillus vitaminiphilus]
MVGEFHVISTGQQSNERLIEVITHIHPYVDAIHLREKQKTAKELAALISVLIAKGVPAEKIMINDRVDVAVVCGAAGVQLAYHSLNVKAVKEHFPSLRVGCSVHSLEEAQEAERDGADYCLYGHIFPTDCKAGLAPRGLFELEVVAKQIHIPVIAIGGIRPNNVEKVLQAGAKGIAVMSGVFLADDPVAEARLFAGILKKWGRKNE